MILHINTNFPKQPPENECGNKEYKRYLFYNENTYYRWMRVCRI